MLLKALLWSMLSMLFMHLSTGTDMFKSVRNIFLINTRTMQVHILQDKYGMTIHTYSPLT